MRKELGDCMKKSSMLQKICGACDKVEQDLDKCLAVETDIIIKKNHLEAKKKREAYELNKKEFYDSL